MRTNTGLPDVVPVLSRGKHRNPRKGACFMEFASFLAGERWSDHPRCTHALLAELARQVNDNLTDEGRHRIVSLLPDVVGLTSDDPRLDVVIVLRAAELAIPAAPFERQRPLAVALLRCEQEFTKSADAESAGHLARCSAALRTAPHATEWAVRFSDRPGVGKRQTFDRTAPYIVYLAVASIVQFGVSVDDRLCQLLELVIADCRDFLGHCDAPASVEAYQFGSAAPAPQ